MLDTVGEVDPVRRRPINHGLGRRELPHDRPGRRGTTADLTGDRAGTAVQ
ncbi:MAG: hypothetical protein QOK35_1933 [Pseudonocardiales bacterium]|jgi:hypothetical protein|nr:hypothetical protein [Pseudonocardiales bacterium]